MITAILTDRKGFQRSIQIPDLWPEVNIPLHEDPTLDTILPGDVMPTYKEISMTFVKENILGIAYGSTVVIYKEKQ